MAMYDNARKMKSPQCSARGSAGTGSGGLDNKGSGRGAPKVTTIKVGGIAMHSRKAKQIENPMETKHRLNKM